MESWREELYHHGIKGQKWGVRRYQDKNGDWTEEGNRRRRKGDGRGSSGSFTGSGLTKSGNHAITIGAAAVGAVLVGGAVAVGVSKLRSSGISMGKIAVSQFDDVPVSELVDSAPENALEYDDRTGFMRDSSMDGLPMSERLKIVEREVNPIVSDSNCRSNSMALCFAMQGEMVKAKPIDSRSTMPSMVMFCFDNREAAHDSREDVLKNGVSDFLASKYPDGSCGLMSFSYNKAISDKIATKKNLNLGPDDRAGHCLAWYVENGKGHILSYTQDGSSIAMDITKDFGDKESDFLDPSKDIFHCRLDDAIREDNIDKDFLKNYLDPR